MKTNSYFQNLEKIRVEREREAAEDAAFQLDLTQFVATLPEPSAAALQRYNEQLNLLESIHNQIEAANKPVFQVGDNYNPSDKLDFKYVESYEVSKY